MLGHGRGRRWGGGCRRVERATCRRLRARGSATAATITGVGRAGRIERALRRSGDLGRPDARRRARFGLGRLRRRRLLAELDAREDHALGRRLHARADRVAVLEADLRVSDDDFVAATQRGVCDDLPVIQEGAVRAPEVSQDVGVLIARSSSGAWRPRCPRARFEQSDARPRLMLVALSTMVRSRPSLERMRRAIGNLRRIQRSVPSASS